MKKIKVEILITIYAKVKKLQIQEGLVKLLPQLTTKPYDYKLIEGDYVLGLGSYIHNVGLKFEIEVEDKFDALTKAMALKDDIEKKWDNKLLEHSRFNPIEIKEIEE